MKTRFDEFEEFLRGIDAETHARVDALVNDPNYQPPKVELLDDLDPFGMDWAWLYEADELSRLGANTAGSAPPPLLPFPSGGQAGRRRWLPQGVFAAVAASLLIGVGVLIGQVFRGGGGGLSAGSPEILLASVMPKFGTVRGTERSLLVEVGSELHGFATIIALAPGRPQRVFPEPGEDPIRVDPPARETYGPLPPDSTIALVLITETPATKLIRDALLDQEFRADDLKQLDGYLRKLLSTSGYRRVGMSFTPIEPREGK